MTIKPLQGEELARHMAAVTARLANQDDDALRAKVDATTGPIQTTRNGLAGRALVAKSAAGKIYWLRQEAALVNKAVAPISPCRSGCSFCCYQGVGVSRMEAELIGIEIGRKPVTPPDERVLSAAMLTRADSPEEQQKRFDKQRQWMVDAYEGIPCTFLVNDRCSIYKSRPMTCRLHISVDQDSLLCRIIPGTTIKVPYLDMSQEQQLYVEVTGVDNFKLADIRDWFPKGAQ